MLLPHTVFYTLSNGNWHYMTTDIKVYLLLMNMKKAEIHHNSHVCKFVHNPFSSRLWFLVTRPHSPEWLARADGCSGSCLIRRKKKKRLLSQVTLSAVLYYLAKHFLQNRFIIVGKPVFWQKFLRFKILIIKPPKLCFVDFRDAGRLGCSVFKMPCAAIKGQWATTKGKTKLEWYISQNSKCKQFSCGPRNNFVFQYISQLGNAHFQLWMILKNLCYWVNPL